MNSFVTAYNIRRANRKAKGGMVRPSEDCESESAAPMKDPKSIASALVAKRMSKGGMVDEEPLSDEDFFSDEADTDLDSPHMPDDPYREAEGMEDPKMKRKGLLHGILSRMK